MRCCQRQNRQRKRRRDASGEPWTFHVLLSTLEMTPWPPSRALRLHVRMRTEAQAAGMHACVNRSIKTGIACGCLYTSMSSTRGNPKRKFLLFNQTWQLATLLRKMPIPGMQSATITARYRHGFLIYNHKIIQLCRHADTKLPRCSCSSVRAFVFHHNPTAVPAASECSAAGRMVVSGIPNAAVP